MANKNYSVNIDVKVNGDAAASQKMDKLQKNMQKVNDTMQKASKMNVKPKFSLNLNTATKQLSEFGKKLSEFGKKGFEVTMKVKEAGTSALEKVNSRMESTTAMLGMGAVGIGAGYLVGESLQKAMEFQNVMTTNRAILGPNVTAAQFQQLTDLAIKEGAATKYSATQAAEGMNDMIKAGFTAKEVLGGGLDAALNLATAGQMDMQHAATVLSDSMNIFKKDGLTAAQTADILAGTAHAAATSVDNLFYAFSSVGGVAGTVGLTMKDTADALGLLANNAIRGSDAGTTLKMFLDYLNPRAKPEQALFKKLGFMDSNGNNQFYDAQGNIKSMADIAQLLQDKLKGLTNEQRTADLIKMFGTDGVKFATVAYKEGAKGVQEFQAQMERTTAIEVARAKMDNATGAVTRFQNALETMQVSAMMPLLPLVTNLAVKMADFVGAKTPAITAAMQSMVDGLTKWYRTSFSGNASFMNKFNQQVTFGGKVKVVWDDLVQQFNTWYSGGGQAKLQAIGEDVTSFLITVLDKAVLDNAGTITSIGVSIGSSLAAGIMQSLDNALQNSWFGKISGFLDIAGGHQAAQDVIAKLDRKAQGLPLSANDSPLQKQLDANAASQNATSSNSMKYALSHNINVNLGGVNVNTTDLQSDESAKIIGHHVLAGVRQALANN